MAAVIPASLKLITSAVRRSEELEKDSNNESKVVAYYCRYFAVSKGSNLCSSPPSAAENAFLAGEIDKLEKMKPELGDMDQDKGASICRSYANSVFEKADDEDRQGVADKATAKMFYAAGTFFDILEQFDEIDQITTEKRKYAKWKATDILGAIKSGQKPTPGGFGEGMADLHLSDGTDGGISSKDLSHQDIPAAPTAAPSASAAMAANIPKAPFAVTPPPSGSSSSAAAVPPPFQAYAPAPTATAPPMNMQNIPSSNFQKFYAEIPPPTFTTEVPYSNKDPRVQDAAELIHFAILAAQSNAIDIAKSRLCEALKRISGQPTASMPSFASFGGASPQMIESSCGAALYAIKKNDMDKAKDQLRAALKASG
mmetsp:Transcript_9167/g.15179  ORF Transcript_9167/g.15179 Transcript_9167/m.15179 type:complete len:370 (+) Transcript_9167:169-1278(+)|eukprot:CAMPEP_0174993090 /NCGR_PEP_ID=MMETSP0004_2-20121128/22885_1 /TAXON_ID=420556 /ORGANISM="Ochromonas sp., Strain CCMP1393" /LENGTH=369 /DNA_ID=CAMNT_0016247173 /DNA_START=163 /DNA_END=1272 /DNA_ORIENTATION=-